MCIQYPIIVDLIMRLLILYCQALSLSLFLSLSISLSLDLSISLRDRDRADTIITLPHHPPPQKTF